MPLCWQQMRGVEVTPLSQHSIEPLVRGGLLFGYANINEHDILLGVQKLARALSRF